MPVLYPELIFCEEGFVVFHDEQLTPFFVVSPDGSLRKGKLMEGTQMAIEIKCPTREIHFDLPPRYLLQCLSEMEAMDVNQLLYLSWTENYTSVFIINRNTILFQMAMKKARVLFDGPKTTVPNKLSSDVQILKDEIVKYSKETQFVGFFPSAKVGKQDTPKEHKSKTVGDIQELLALVTKLDTSLYELKRERATEAVVFICADLNRRWNKEMTRSAPVAWFTKGYSLDTRTMRGIAEEVHDRCHNTGLHIPCQSFDGQWHNLVVRDIENMPLTILQLQKDVWREVEQTKKTNIISRFRDMNKSPKWVYTRKEGAIVIEVSNYIMNVPKLKRVGKLNTPEQTVQTEKMAEFDENERESRDVNENGPIDTNVAEGGVSDRYVLDGEIEDSQSVHNIIIHETESGTREDEQSNECDDTESKDREENITDQTNNILRRGFGHKVTDQDANCILALLRTYKSSNKKNKWDLKQTSEIEQALKCFDTLRSMLDVELRVVVRYFRKTQKLTVKETATKQNKLRVLSEYLGITFIDPVRKTGRPSLKKKTSPKRLSELSIKVLSTCITKHELNSAYSECVWPDRFSEWKTRGAVMNMLQIDGVDTYRDWFYHPEFSKRRNQLEVKCIDATHLLTRTRRKCCKGGLDNLSNDPWKLVAKSGNTLLTPIMVEEVTDPMFSSMAATHFSEVVEFEMRQFGRNEAADLCRDIRLWWEAEDSSCHSAKARFDMREGLRGRLLFHVNFDIFPPPTMYVAGWPMQLWEALLARIDAKTILYSLCHAGSYNVRAFSSLIGETFFSELVLHDKTGSGTVTAGEFGRFIGTAVEQLQVRLNPNRKFIYRTGRSHAYGLTGSEETTTDVLNEDSACQACEPQSTITCINLKDHAFDTQRRRESKKRLGTVSKDRNATQEGTLGVRWEQARRNESKMLLTSRMGIDA